MQVVCFAAIMLLEVLKQNVVQDVRDRRDSEIIAFGDSAGLATC